MVRARRYNRTMIATRCAAGGRPACGWKVFLAATCLAWLATLPVAGQQLPSGREIVARHVEALGGAAAYARVSSLVAKGRWEVPAQGFTGSFELESARPNKMLYRVTAAGIGRIETGFDGTVGWSLNPLVGPELLDGKQLSETADEAWFDAPLHLPEHVRELTTLGLAEFDGRSAYRVHVVLASGNEQTEYFDVESGLQIGTEAVRTTPQGPVPTVNLLRDYKRFGALLQPTTVIQRALGLEQVITITSLEYDSVADDAFAVPAEIRALLPQ